MSLAIKLVDEALKQWELWGFSAVPLHGNRVIAGREAQPPYVTYVNDYWKIVGHPTWNGNTKMPWSAAFISYCFNKANAGASFPYSAAHVGYCRAFVQNPGKYPGLAFADPALEGLAVGDLVFAGRTGPKCSTPPPTHASALAEMKSHNGSFCSHADIVVEIRAGEIDVIGGNVSDSVTMTTYKTAGGKIVDSRHNWLGVIKNAL